MFRENAATKKEVRLPRVDRVGSIRRKVDYLLLRRDGPQSQGLDMLLEAGDCQLILIDYQVRLMPAIAEGERVLLRAHQLARVAAALGVPVIGTEQSPEKLGAAVEPLRGLYGKVLPKLHFSACRDGLVDLVDEIATPKASPNARSIPKHLQKPAQKQRTHLVLAGCEAHVCLLQTAVELLDTEEYEVSVVTDACGSRHAADRDAAFDRLAGAGVQLVTTEMVVFEWLGGADHPKFKEVQSLIKA